MTLLAGAAVIDITPVPGGRMDGYGARNDVSQGVHDPLHARALVLEQGGARCAIVSCDLLGMHADAGIELRIVPDLGALWARLPRASRSAASACATSDAAVGQTRCLTPDMSARGRVAQSGCGGALWKERHTFGAVSGSSLEMKGPGLG